MRTVYTDHAMHMFISATLIIQHRSGEINVIFKFFNYYYFFYYYFRSPMQYCLFTLIDVVIC